MRKFFRGLLVLAVLTVGMGTVFTSCKDNNDELKEISKEMIDLNNQIKSIREAQEACKNLCQTRYEEYQTTILQLNVALSSLQEAVDGKAEQSTVDALTREVDELRDKVQQAADDYATAMAAYEGLQGQLDLFQAALELLESKKASQEDLDATNSELAELKALVEQLQNNVGSSAGQVAEDLKDYQQKSDSIMNALQDQIDSLTGQCTCQPTCDSLKNAFLAFEISMNNFKSTSQTAINNLNSAVDSLKLALKDYPQVKQNASDALAKAGTNERRLNTLKASVDSLIGVFNNRDKVFTDSLKTLDGRIDSAITVIENLKTRLDGVDADILALYGFNDSISGVTTDLAKRLAAAEATIIQHTADIAAVNTRVDNLLAYVDGRLDSMITSITLEGTYNPVFGSVSTPFGVTSYVLMAYYGMTPRGDVDFPTPSTSTEYCELEAPILTDADMQMLAAEVETYGGTFVQGMDKDGNVKGNAGTVYFRVNPGTVDMEGKTFSLVDTRDKESGIKLEKAVKSDTQLRFGYTFGRSQETNGFYEAEATLTPDNVWSTKVEVESGLKSSFADVLKELRDRKVDPTDLMEVAKLLYDQFNGILPANAVKGEWTYLDAAQSPVSTWVYSPSGLAGTCFKPLGFNFLLGKSFRHIREFDPLTEFEIINPDDFTFNIELKPIHLKEPNVTINLSPIKINESGKIIVTGDVVDNDGVKIGQIANVEVDSSTFIEDIENAVNSSIDGWNQSIKNDLESQLKSIQDDIQTQVNRLLDDINGQISGQLNDMISKINNRFKDKTGNYFDRINGFIKRYNRLARRINRVLDDPNHYLQPILLYEGNDGGFHILSGNIDRPSRFVLNGGNAIYLYPTTRNGEIVVPVFKKFVGVTNVWKSDDANVSAQNGNAAAKALLDKANANKNGNMNKVFDGQNLHVALEVPSSAKGYTYEIVYQALDYHGLTSTLKCYVTVE